MWNFSVPKIVYSTLGRIVLSAVMHNVIFCMVELFCLCYQKG